MFLFFLFPSLFCNLLFHFKVLFRFEQAHLDGGARGCEGLGKGSHPGGKRKRAKIERN